MNWLRIVLALLFCICVNLSGVRAGGVDSSDKLFHLVQSLKAINNLGYRYSMDAVFSNGDKDKFEGSAYCDVGKNNFFNSSDACTMISSDNWMYYADHRNKTVSIIGLNKKSKGKKNKGNTPPNYLKYSLVTSFIDSVLLNTAFITKYSKNGDEIFAEMGFPENSVVKRLQIRFDERKKIPITYDLDVHYILSKDSRGVSAVTSKIKCDNFKVNENWESIGEANYFMIANGKVELKKFTSYKVLSKL
jgi:hypothetical protein